MKIKEEHYRFIAQKINHVIEENPDMYNNYKNFGLSDMRYRWDLFHIARLTEFACSILYSYLNDDHIDTALRNITGTK